MVDMDERPKGWNKELYDKLSFDFLIECSQHGGIDEWNLRYEAYLKSEWERIFPHDKEYDPKNIGKLFYLNSGFVRPGLSGKDIKNAIDRGAHFFGAHFKGANFSVAHLEGAQFFGAHLEGANLTWVHLDRADFRCAHLEGADLYYAHLGGADFSLANLEGARFNYVMVNGETLFINNTIDDKTDFTGTNLSLLRINPNLKKHLERNIRKLNITNTNVFVAMKFDSPDIDSALENAIKPACLECGGLQACTVNEKAGDGWIPQRIREEIQDARFVISDLTYRNPGVYYETGYADGLEIPVIQTCKRSWYDKDPAPLHFDIAQRNTIFWNDDNDLKQQLIMKIQELQENGK